MKTRLNSIFFESGTSVFQDEYFELLITRLTNSSMSLETDLGDPNLHKNAIRLRDNMKAFKMLITMLNKELTEDDVIVIANTINESSQFISNGYRKSGKFIADTNIPISTPENIQRDMLQLLDNYHHNWKELEPFEREAKFHIDFIRIHPFEDGNGRTARLLLNYNLLKQGIAPVIITNDLREYYESYIKNKDVDALTNLLKIQSIKESEIINYLISEYNQDNTKTFRKL